MPALGFDSRAGVPDWRQLISLKAGSTNPSGPLVHAVESAAK